MKDNTRIIMANKIIARKDEVKILENLLSTDSPEFLALYGRRRVGRRAANC